jgi:alpha,alpha-trehalase
MLSLVALSTCQRAHAPAPYWQAGRPAFVFGELYARVESDQLFADSKTFADAQPTRAPAMILHDYLPAATATRPQLLSFVKQNFTLPRLWDGTPAPGLDLAHHIAALWPLLTRPSQEPVEFATGLGAPFPYVVPGGRLRELHYTESYFIMLGLVRDGQLALAHGQLDDCAALINRFGHMPAGSRTYYLSRSGLPLFYRMIELLYPKDPVAGYVSYLPELKREYSFWMQGSTGLAPGQSIEHVVAMPDGALLNRFWDALGEPRDEDFREDSLLAAAVTQDRAALYRNVRAAAESGWGLSERWLAQEGVPASVQTTSLVPIDLNSVLFGLERAIASACERRGDQSCATQFLARAWRRKQAINRYLWDAGEGRYVDYNWQRAQASPVLSAAMFYPLFVGIASPAQAESVVALASQRLLSADGLMPLAVPEAAQVTSPEIWASLQWIAMEGLNNYGKADLSRSIAARWLGRVRRDFAQSGRLAESAAQESLAGTAGVIRALLPGATEPSKSRSPRDSAARPTAADRPPAN